MNIDRSAWGRLRVTGGDRVRFLQGLTTVNVETLAAGGDEHGAHGWGAILNPKGRVLSVIDIARTPKDGAFVISCEAKLADTTKQILERYAVMDDVEFTSITGPAHQVWTDVASVWTAPIVEGHAGDLLPETDLAVERLRIRGGFLRYGADVDDDHFPFETPLAQSLDYSKGCYVGQEPVFRVHAQGNAARMLHGFVIRGHGSFVGVAIEHPQKSNAGKVTSAVVDGDRTIALGYLHRTAWEGTAVKIGGFEAEAFKLPMEAA